VVQVWVQLGGKVLYRPAQGDPVPVRKPASPTASLELNRQADWVLIFGVLSVVLGWTVLVPFFGLCCYLWAYDTAKSERVLVPSKATIGLLLSLLFGAGQGLAMILHFWK
jgi:hypothetical protein